MADIAASLFFKASGYSVGEIKFDLILEESHSLVSTITKHKVQDGRTISDHIRNELRNGTFTGTITNYSISTPGVDGNRALDVYEQFKTLWRKKELVQLVLILDVYQSVAIKNVSTKKTASTGDRLDFVVQFEELEIVELETVNISTMNNSLNRLAAKKATPGRILPISRDATVLPQQLLF